MKQFLKIVFGGLVALFLFFFLLILLFGAMMGTQEVAPRLADKSLLVLDLSRPIADHQPYRSLSALLGEGLGEGVERRQRLRRVVTAIERAADDDKVVGLYIKGQVVREGYHSGWAALKEVRRAIARFARSGKPVVTWQEELDEATLYVVSPARRIVLHPLGLVEFNGLAAEVLYWAEAFERYGIQAQVTRVGKYKSAVEPYVRRHMSPENREQLGALLGDLFDEVVEAVAADRKADAETLRRLSRQQGALDAEEALRLGLVTEVGYYDRVLAQLRRLTGSEEGKPLKGRIDVSDYFDTLDEPDGGKVAVIYAEGMIVSGDGLEEVAGDRLARLLRKAREDDEVDAVVLRINSPGGSATASDVILRETERLKENKPLVVSMGSVAASGGYWIASQADEIWAQPNTITGSIGVFGLFFNVKRLINDHGLYMEVVRTSPLADALSLFRPKEERELAIVQRFIDKIYDRFVALVAQGRHLTPEQVEALAQGRVWSGRRAKELGLVDHLGGLQQAVTAAAQRAGLGEDYAVEEYPKAREWVELLLEEMGLLPEEESQGNPLEGLWRQLRALRHYDDPAGAYARMPFDLTIR